GEMDVDRTVESDSGLTPTGDLLSMALGVGQGQTAARIAGAGNETSADRGGRGREVDRLNGGLGGFDAPFRNTRDQQVLPYRETDVAVAEITGNRSEPA